MGASINRPGREAPAQKTPMRVALSAHAAQGDAALECLLSDAAEAIAVYAQLAGVEGPELVRASCGRDLAGCPAVLLTLRLGGRGHATEETLLPYAEPGASVYALIAVDGEPGIAAHAVAELEDAFDVPVCLGCEGRMIEETLIGDDETVISLGEALTKEDITFLLDSVFNP